MELALVMIWCDNDYHARFINNFAYKPLRTKPEYHSGLNLSCMRGSGRIRLKYNPVQFFHCLVIFFHHPFDHLLRGNNSVYQRRDLPDFQLAFHQVK